MRNWKMLTIFSFCFFLGLGITLRLKPMSYWADNPDIYFVDNEPVFASADGYYYLNIAKELQTGSYSSIDTKRAIPDTISRKSSPPLLPVLLHSFSSLLGTSLSWIGLWLPIILSSCLLFPVYLIGKEYGGKLSGIYSLAIVSTAPIYLSRTRLGWLDTDCLNVVLPFFCTYCFMKFGNENSKYRYLYLSSGFLFFFIFLWWWDMSSTAVIILSLSSLFIALVFDFRPKCTEVFLFYIILAAFVVAYMIIDSSFFAKFINSLTNYMRYFSKTAGMFPNIGVSIVEQQKLSSLQNLNTIVPNLWCLIIAVLGTLYLLFKKKSQALYILPMLILGAFSFFYANRFSIFLVPVFALGFGYFFAQLQIHVTKKYVITIFYIIAAASLVWSSAESLTQKPFAFTGNIVKGMKMVKATTPADSVVWSWWDEGHPLVYWSDRATINDGMVHNGERNFYTALPLASSDLRFSANFMQFYVLRGMAGINLFIKETGGDFNTAIAHLKYILSAGPVDGDLYLQTIQFGNTAQADSIIKTIEFYYPSETKPLYLFLDDWMMKIFRWIYWYGTWNPKTQAGIASLPILKMNDIEYRDQTPLNDTISLDWKKGLLSISGTLKSVSVHDILVINGSESLSKFRKNTSIPKKRIPFEGQFAEIVKANEMLTDSGSYDLVLDITEQKMTVIDSKINNTALFKLYKYGNMEKNAYFQQVEGNSGNSQLWEVRGDRL